MTVTATRQQPRFKKIEDSHFAGEDQAKTTVWSYKKGRTRRCGQSDREEVTPKPRGHEARGIFRVADNG